VKAMIVALVKVGNVIQVGTTNTISVIPQLIDVKIIYFVGISVRISIKVSIYLFYF
jgi:hypothetical protein